MLRILLILLTTLFGVSSFVSVQEAARHPAIRAHPLGLDAGSRRIGRIDAVRNHGSVQVIVRSPRITTPEASSIVDGSVPASPSRKNIAKLP